ncbi:hypothetical protein [Halobellus litoreus]|uniref:Uncharacterized protein n=1 Tax=Halobellus litoreus TaxID=755310 RepID=A0ABD6DRY7_9EURY|nr:hypothetical protein [Halobellus litoreus]
MREDPRSVIDHRSEAPVDARVAGHLVVRPFDPDVFPSERGHREDGEWAQRPRLVRREGTIPLPVT